MWNGTNFRRAAPVAALFALAALSHQAIGADVPWGIAGLVQLAGSPAAAEERLEIVTSSGVHVISVEVARTPEQQRLGLMFRTSLAADKGMLFPHSPPRESQMWMRNTYIPLDMVFIRADGVVHRIEKRTEPFSERVISSNGEVAGVLELAGGVADQIGLKPGDLVRHSQFKAK